MLLVWACLIWWIGPQFALKLKIQIFYERLVIHLHLEGLRTDSLELSKKSGILQYLPLSVFWMVRIVSNGEKYVVFFGIL